MLIIIIGLYKSKLCHSRSVQDVIYPRMMARLQFPTEVDYIDQNRPPYRIHSQVNVVYPQPHLSATMHCKEKAVRLNSNSANSSRWQRPHELCFVPFHDSPK